MNPLLSETAQRNIVLASRSPRRHEIMKGLGFEFEVCPAAEHVEDLASHRDPFQWPLECARLKADDVASRFPDALVIAADTVVILGEELLEKPRDDAEATRFLKKLSGQTHTVVTGVALCRAARGLHLGGKEETRVRFRELSDDEVVRYVQSGEGRDKAGSYAVQGLGAGLVRSVDGCFYNVVGLPVALLFDLMKEAAS